MSKKLQEKQRKRLAEQMRREQQRKATRRSNLITIGIALAIAATVTVFIMSERSGDDAPPAPAGVAMAEAGCDDVENHEEEGANHVDGDVEYETSPPTSGDHYETPADAGFYPDAVPEETLVHNLEHGQIVIWYDPEASTQTKNDLQEFAESANDPDAVRGNSPPPIVAAPYEDVPSGKSYALTAWTHSQACSAYSLEAINDFRAQFQGDSPEPITAPFEEE